MLRSCLAKIENRCVLWWIPLQVWPHQCSMFNAVCMSMNMNGVGLVQRGRGSSEIGTTGKFKRKLFVTTLFLAYLASKILRETIWDFEEPVAVEFGIIFRVQSVCGKENLLDHCSKVSMKLVPPPHKQYWVSVWRRCNCSLVSCPRGRARRCSPWPPPPPCWGSSKATWSPRRHGSLYCTVERFKAVNITIQQQQRPQH